MERQETVERERVVGEEESMDRRRRMRTRVGMPMKNRARRRRERLSREARRS
jgi:hypothetical protein